MPAEVLPHSRRIMSSGPITAASLLRLYPNLRAGLAYDLPHTPTDSLRVATLSPPMGVGVKLLPCIFPAVLQHV